MSTAVGFVGISLLVLLGLLALAAFRKDPSSKQRSSILKPPFQVLYPASKNDGSDGTDIDIIAVHSPNSNAKAEREWTYEIHDELKHISWLKDPGMLPSIVPKARIMIYTYNSAWTSTFNASKASLDRCGEEMMRRLNNFQGQDTKRPVIFIGHSVGGIVIEHGLIFAQRRYELRHLVENTAGCVFLGTPFRGSVASGFLTKTAAMLQSALMNNLVLDVEALEDEMLEFANLAQTIPIQVACFYELYKTDFGLRFGLPGLFRVLVVTEKSATLPGWKKLGLLADHTNMNKFSNPTDSSFLKVSAEIHQMYENKAVALGQAKDTYPVQFMVPFGRNERFTGRTTILEQLLTRIPPDSNCDTCQRTVLEGLGGVGKTQVALEAIYRLHHQDPACSIFWVSAETLTSFENSYHNIAQRLQIPGFDDFQEDVKILIKESLSQEACAGKWLMIIDNADDPGLLFHGSSLVRYLPFSRYGSILFTTRDHQVAVSLGAMTIRVEPMGFDEAHELLRSTIEPGLVENEHEISTKDLLEQLAYLPLAISQASAYMDKYQVTSTQYLEAFRSNDDVMMRFLSQEFQTHGRHDFHQNPVTKTWALSFYQLRQSNQLAAEYLQRAAFLDGHDIPFLLLPPAGREISTIEAVGALKALAFIRQRYHDSFDIHPLVQASVRSWVKDSEKWDAIIGEAVERMNEVLPIPEYQTRDPWLRCLPHVLSVLKFANEVEGEYDPNLLQLMSKAGTCLNEIGRYEQAEAVFQESLTKQTRVLGPEHPETLLMSNKIAVTLFQQGKFDEAVTLQRKVVNKRQQLLGADHPDALESVNNLALVLEQQGKYEEAERIHKQTLNLREKTLGEKHPSTLASMNNLASVLQQQGRYEEAERLLRQTLGVTMEMLGKEHLDTLASMNNLAVVLRQRGRHKEAKEMQRQTLTLRNKVLGEEHPSTLDSMNNLAEVLRQQGKHREAEEMHRQTLYLRKKALGEEHPSTLDSINNLAEVLRQQGKHREAEEMHRQTLYLRKKALGEEHPSTLDSINNLAEVLRQQGKHREAEEMHRQTLYLREKVLGEEHPSTLASINNLTLVLEQQGKYEEAEEMHRQTLDLREKVLGEEHPDTLASMNNLAEVLRQQGKYEEAEEIHRQTLDLREKVLGEEHPDTLASMNNIAILLEKQGKYAEAEEMHRQTLDLMQKVLGEEHPDKLGSMNNLAIVLQQQGKYEEAEEMHRQILDLRKKVLGEEHPDTLDSMNNLALVLEQRGKYKEAVHTL